MNITSISSYQPQQNFKQVQFRGINGYRLLQRPAGTLETGAVMKEMSGTFGFNKDKVKDIMEAFIEKLKGVLAE